MKHYLQDQIVIITGGSSGFGLATADLLLELGSKVVITGRTEEKLQQALVLLKKPEYTNRIIAVKADACLTDDWNRVVQKTVDTFGTINILICNHGAAVKVAPVDEMSDEELLDIMNTNILAAIKGARAVIPVMKKNKRGTILNVSSGCAIKFWANWAVYTAAKAGMVGFTKCLHKEMETWGGRATCFIPGAARTNFCNAAHIDSSWQAGYPLPEDMARTIVHSIDQPDHCVMENVTLWGTKQVADISPF